MINREAFENKELHYCDDVCPRYPELHCEKHCMLIRKNNLLTCAFCLKSGEEKDGYTHTICKNCLQLSNINRKVKE